ncbi:hypothetical protein Q5P01_016660 [Channa striata]|uniref:Uncharacterized protein n=1 Tax=Channa striata TaxID=64152 RepID=A0AA88M9T6_CHASR|nr:hypothetical protein Q5P01_016660 [Channa striata]
MVFSSNLHLDIPDLLELPDSLHINIDFEKVRGSDEGKGRKTRGSRRSDPCGGGQDGWMAASHAMERRERGKMEGGEGRQDGDEE